MLQLKADFTIKCQARRAVTDGTFLQLSVFLHIRRRCHMFYSNNPSLPLSVRHVLIYMLLSAAAIIRPARGEVHLIYRNLEA